MSHCSSRYCRSRHSRKYAIHLCSARVFTYLKVKQYSIFHCLVFEIVSFGRTKHRLGVFRMDTRGRYLEVAGRMWKGAGENCVMRNLMITLTDYVSLILSRSDFRGWRWWGCDRYTGRQKCVRSWGRRLKERDSLWDLGVDGKVVLKCIVLM